MAKSRKADPADEESAATALLPWQSFWDYSLDFWQRNVLYLDVMRRRGNQYLEHASKPVQHVLRYDFEKVMDGRELPRPVNYGLVRILPPEGMEIDDAKRPFIIVDPRAGHGPGIGGFKQTSEVGAVLNAGHPCYFIGFLAEPVPGQTIEDVGSAELTFIQHVAELHPSVEGKPCVIGNCQAGWAMIMLASVAPDAVGPILIAGAPLSYWAGVRGKNPMRYTGGLLGGTWLSSLTSDLGHGIFDGAYLVQNMENLNPAHTLWGKQYNLWSKIDTEAERYLDFERWWGGHVLLTGEEIQFITDELFVGNKLMRGEIETSGGTVIDPRNIRSPIVVFCSHGDNITPPQQALEWILDLYQDVDEIRAYGQTIVYALHQDIGHLGIFVSGRVGQKEHDQFTQNMDLIDVLAPGLYEAVMREKTPEDDNAELAYGDYVVTFEMRDLDDIRALGDQSADDDRAFEAVARVSEINRSLYQAFMSPFVRSAVTEESAVWMRNMQPARTQYSLFSDYNPFLAWTAAAAETVRSHRQPVQPDNPFLAFEHQLSDGITAGLNSWRDQRDAMVEQLFFGLYGSDAMQALLGLTSDDPDQHARTNAKSAAKESLLREKIRDLQRRIGSGGPREAAVRALIYVGLPEGKIDERGFGALKLMHAQTPEQERMPLRTFKQLVREQFFMLLINEDEALRTLPDMLPKGAEARRALFDRVQTVLGAPGKMSKTRTARLRQVAECFGLDTKKPANDKTPGKPRQTKTRKQTSPSSSTRRPRARRARKSSSHAP
ncbi:MAG: DUF3141 domain-containing protein [Geminicoccaceae bacterium]